ncbi:transporter substrate-binding domain-containing protein [Desulfopila sp. IMCC35008]|uniref:ABC transporter substrate-binding protein n=1 Tax=Desulfopila sp. IMCC35008 TaxID=2653858 RepID=UPI0013D85E92|nr:transporter substrate-binding domain-containing protein [Desulfopila sp. IMCC35008]
MLEKAYQVISHYLTIYLAGTLILLFGISCDLAFAEVSIKENVTILLPRSHQFQYAGYYAAIDKGFYAEEGLTVTLTGNAPSSERYEPVLRGRAQYGVGDAGLLMLRAEGHPVVLLAQIFQHTPNVLITKKSSNIFSPYELLDRSIVLPENSRSNSALAVRAMLLETLGSMERINVVPRVYRDTTLSFDHADAVTGSLTRDQFLLKQQGIAIRIVDPRDYGIDFYGDNFYTTEKEILMHPERVEKVRRATIKGWEYALKNKEAVIDLILKRYNSGISREQLRFEAEIADQMILPDLVDIGKFDTRRFARMAEILYQTGLSRSPDISEGFFFNQKPDSHVRLTPEEKDWLNAHPDIRFVYSNDYQPTLIAHEDGSVTGSMKDILDLLNEKLGTDFGIVVTDLDSGRQMVQERAVSGWLATSHAAAKRLGLIATDSPIRTYLTIFGRSGGPSEIKRIENLQGYRLAIVGPMTTFAELVEPYEDRIAVTRVKTVFDGLKMLFEGKVDFFFGLSQHTYVINANQFTGLRPVLVMADRPINAVMGVRSDWPQLVAIINKGLAAISSAERNAIYAKWNGGPNVTSPQVALSAEERGWLKKHPRIILGTNAAWTPLVMVDENGSVQGIDAEFISLLNQKLGTNIILKAGKWTDLVDQAKARRIDGLASSASVKERREHFLFSNTYAPLFKYIYTRADQDFGIQHLQDLIGRRVAVQKGNIFEKKILGNISNVKVIQTKDHNDAVDKLIRGEVDAMLAGPSVYYNSLANKIAAIKIQHVVHERPLRLVYSIRKDWPELVGILNKGLKAITEAEKLQIFQKYAENIPWKDVPFIGFTEEETEWIKKNQTMRVGITDMPPFMFSGNDRRTVGITIDILDLIAQRTGLHFRYDDYFNLWDESLEIIENPIEPDLIQRTGISVGFDDVMLNSSGYMRSPQVVFTDQSEQPVLDIRDLSGKTVSVKHGSHLHRLFSREYPQLKLLVFESDLEALKSVHLGRATAYVGALTMASKMISQKGWTNLKVAGPSGLADLWYFFGIREDLPELRSIIEKGLGSISDQERLAIQNKYVTMRYEHGISSREMIIWMAGVGGLAGGVILLVLFWNRSLTERVRKRTADLGVSHEKLQKSEQLARLLLNAPSDLILLIDEDGIILDLNTAKAKVLGSTKRELINTCIFDYFTDELKAARKGFLQEVIRTWKPLCFTDKRVPETIYESTIYPIESSAGEKRKLVLFSRDITERERARKERMALQNELAHINRLMTINELSSSLAHEINQPLGAILNNVTSVQILHSELPEHSGKIQDILERIAGDAYRAGQIIRRIRGVVKKEESKNELLDVNELLDDTLELFRNTLNLDSIVLRIEKYQNIPQVIGDRIRLQQVVMNLISNALDAMRDSDPKILTVQSSLQLPEWVAISIGDSGSGIPDDLKDKVFSPFFTTKNSGLGVGLRICRSIIEEHGGRIWIDVNPEGGTIFRFTLETNRVDIE